MPRTKQPRKKSLHDYDEEVELLTRDFERQTKQKILKYEADAEMMMNRCIASIQDVEHRLPQEIRKMKLGKLLAADLKDEDYGRMEVSSTNQDSPSPPVSSTIKGTAKKMRTTAASDDGYATESTIARTHVSRINSTKTSSKHRTRKTSSSSRTRTTRSSSANRTKLSSPKTRNSRLTLEHNRNDMLQSGMHPPISSKYKTPCVKAPATCFNTVTPKIKPNTPLNILRRPRAGETVLSMQGSPLLVSSVVQENIANINVPLDNGSIISMLPIDGLRLSHIPSLDQETKDQLKTLKAHLEKVIGK